MAIAPHAAIVVKPLEDDRRPRGHRADSFATIVCSSKSGPVGAAGLRDLRRRNVRGEGRLAEYADVDHQGSDALTLDLLLEERVFGALCV
jgi:hypothetical protein